MMVNDGMLLEHWLEWLPATHVAPTWSCLSTGFLHISGSLPLGRLIHSNGASASAPWGRHCSLGGVHGFPMFSSPVSSHVENPLQMEALSGKINYKWWMFKPWLIDDTGGYHHPGSWRTQYQFLHLDDMSINSGVDFGIHSTNPRVDDNMYRSKSEGFFRLSKSGWSCPFASGAVSYSTPWWVCHGILEAGIRSVWSKPLFCRAGPVGLACGIRETCSEDEGYWWTLMECAVSTLDSRALSSTSQNLAGQIRWKLLLSGTTSLSGGCASKINHESSKGIMLHKQGGT